MELDNIPQEARTMIELYRRAIKDSHYYTPADLKEILVQIGLFGKEALIQAHEIHLKYLIQHRVPKPADRSKTTATRTARQITLRSALMKRAKDEISRLKNELAAETNNVCTRSMDTI